MVRLLLDEAKKLRGSWYLVVLAVAASLAPVFAVIGAWSNALHDPRAHFNGEAILSQFFLNAVMIFHPLTFGILAAFLLQREYQNRTLQALLLVPRSRRDLLSAKIVFVGLVSLGATAYALGLALILGTVFGVDYPWELVVSAGLPIFTAWAVSLPCLTAVFVVTILTRNLMAAVAFCLVALFAGVAAATAGDVAFFFPWSLPFVLGAPHQMLLNQGMDPSLAPRAWAIFVAFGGVSVGSAYWLFETGNAD